LVIGIVVVTHGSLGHVLIETAEMIIGEQENVHAIALNPDSNLDTLRDEVIQATQQADTGQGVLLLVDMFGGTPANAAAASRCAQSYQCLCGVNLPMLLEAFLRREEMPLDELAARVELLACESIVNLRAALERALHNPAPARAGLGDRPNAGEK